MLKNPLCFAFMYIVKLSSRVSQSTASGAENDKKRHRVRSSRKHDATMLHIDIHVAIIASKRDALWIDVAHCEHVSI